MQQDLNCLAIPFLEQILSGEVDKEHAHVLGVYLSQRRGDRSVEEDAHGGDEGVLDGNLVRLGHARVQREEGA